MTVPTYLSQEGFEEGRKGIFFSREVNTTVTATISPNFWNLTVNEFTYKDIRSEDLAKAVDSIHSFTGTSLVVALYNLQFDVISKKTFAIKEDI